MLKSTILSAVTFMFLFVVWTITPAQAHIGDPCPHKDQTHEHCNGGVPATALAVFDTNDNVVGTFIGVLSEGREVAAVVALEIDGHVITLNMNKDNFFGREGKIYFELDGCTGLAFFQCCSLTPTILPAVAVGFPSNIVYIEDPNGISQPMVTESFLLVSTIFSQPASGICSNNNAGIEAIPALPVVDLDTLFTPPFRVELRTE